MLLYRSEATKAAMRTETLAPPSLTETAPLALAAADGVDEGMTAAAAVPLRALATFWNAEKLRGEVSTELMAKTMPAPQWLEGDV